MPELRPGETPTVAHYVAALRSRWWMVVVVGVAALLVGRVVIANRSHTYGASTKIVIAPSPADPTPAPDMERELEIVRSDAVARGAIALRGMTGDVQDALREVRAASAAKSLTMDITSRSPDPGRARDIAAGFAEAYLAARTKALADHDARTVAGLEREDAAIRARLAALQPNLDAARRALSDARATDDLAEVERRSAVVSELSVQQAQDQQRLTDVGAELFGARSNRDSRAPVGEILRAASVPVHPLEGSDAVWWLAFGSVGILVGIAAAFLLWRRDQSYDPVAALEGATGAPVLASVSNLRSEVLSRFAADDRRADAGDVVARFALARRRVLTLAAGPRPAIVAVVPCDAKDALRNVAAGLALAATNEGEPTSLVCADFAAPTALPAGSASPQPTLATLLREPTTAFEPPAHGVHVVTAGAADRATSDLLASDALRDAVGRVADGHRTVILGVAPPLDSADGLAAANVADLVVLVAGSRAKDLRRAEATATMLRRAGCRPAGVVRVAG